MAGITQEQEHQAYLEEYHEMVRRLQVLSNAAVRQFLGSRAEGDPRVEYLTGLEASKNLVTAQLAAITSILSALLGKKVTEFQEIGLTELRRHVTSMEKDLGVIGWSQDGTMRLDLQDHLEKTKGWPP